MLRIMICDDDNLELEKIYDLTKNFLEAYYQEAYEITKYDKAFDFLDAVEKNGVPDIALLDICMPGVLGTELARELKKKAKEKIEIVFLTTSSEFAVEAFSLHATDYLLKPYSKEKLEDTLKRILTRRLKRCYTVIKCGTQMARIDLYDVSYVEAAHNFIFINLKNKEVLKANLTLKKFYEEFNNLEGFYELGASYLVNLRAIQVINDNIIVLTTGEKITIPRRLKNDFKQAYFDFYKKEALSND